MVSFTDFTMMLLKRILFFSLVALQLSLAQSMYPDDHWDYSTKLTKSNFDQTIGDAIDVGKTVFVRWIASPG